MRFYSIVTYFQVLYIDNGFRVKILTASLLVPHESVTKAVYDTPAYVFECRLSNIEPVMNEQCVREWTPKSIREFKNAVEGALLNGVVYSVVDGVVRLQLFAVKDQEEICINDLLVKQQLAVVAPESYRSEVSNGSLKIWPKIFFCCLIPRQKSKYYFSYAHTQWVSKIAKCNFFLHFLPHFLSMFRYSLALFYFSKMNSSEFFAILSPFSSIFVICRLPSSVFVNFGQFFSWFPLFSCPFFPSNFPVFWQFFVIFLVFFILIFLPFAPSFSLPVFSL